MELFEIIQYAICGLEFSGSGSTRIGFGIVVAAKLSQDFEYLEYLSSLSNEQAQEEIENQAEEVLEGAIGERLVFLLKQSGEVVEDPYLHNHLTHHLIPNEHCSVSKLSGYWNDLILKGVESQIFADTLPIWNDLNFINEHGTVLKSLALPILSNL